MQLPSYVVDTSVAVKWYLQRDEANVKEAFRLLDDFRNRRCVLRAPELLLFEVANALASSRIEPSDLLEALDHLRSMEIELEAVRWQTLTKAVEIAHACGATVYDSYFLSLALETNSILVTADRAFLRRARGYSGITSLESLRLSS
ncbi:MAG: type II toxin-antitoxin system VapC family toxin [Acidobacteria bacterium]|nr:type II toxin-antitoxin system VapC family toxin [Acidobacteriota bacterium]MBI1983338.1 type II toxin-antitoxin system VapC family toxin [Acidobacteriota bacterium]